MLRLREKFCKNNDGNFAILSAVGFSAILLCVGASIDLTNNVNIRSKLGNSVDMAVLTAAISEQSRRCHSDLSPLFWKAFRQAKKGYDCFGREHSTDSKWS